ncbi:MAG TPA: NAD+ synthase [Acidimicrobiales bacterium]|nr:NAD+ synthase [Acidimicrobiales bacterium]
MARLRLAAAQLDTVVGDLDGNVARILGTLEEAERAGADLCVFPELAVTGYPPEDLLLKPGFVADSVRALEAVAEGTRDCVAVVGFVEPDGTAPGGRDRPIPADGGPGAGRAMVRDVLHNAAAVCRAGRVAGVYRKRLLPNYGVFDEQRWFTPGDGLTLLYEVAGARVAVSICEDVWFPDGPVAEAGRGGAQLVVNLNASPYSRDRRRERLDMLGQRVREARCAIAYVNQVGGQDELVFDGASLVLDVEGRLVAAGRQFAEDLVLVDLELPERPPDGGARHPVVELTESGRAPGPPRAAPLPAPLDPEAEVYEALVLGTRDYLAKNGFSDAVIGLSGGIDSSLVATVAVDALGSEHVHALAMPSRYSSEGSLTDATRLAANLGLDLHVVPIEPAHVALAGSLTPVLGDPPAGLTDENLQSRIRGVLLMAVSNDTGWIVLTTGNKSELATGYSTLYGDSAGGFAVIKDVPKTLVYELCRYRNRRGVEAGSAAPIPEAVLVKAPSAELRPDQRDDQSLPPYELLDPVLEAYVEGDRTAGDLLEAGFDPGLIELVVRLVDGAEYKRRQMPPGVRVTTKAFGKDRRMPITNRYRTPVSEAAPARRG